ncbi:zinc-dependent alcohol dehydrogenase [Neobacillus cucumis]|uniref:zinc-dependent alcohol dehydrogenase n=1 Tax=Neobacillus cucumis TaxID=1740721 RepID=UPI002E1BD6CE|nr:alcohol dehydrogenase catalytic domain-containing protein [Neobacillus cucumis]
MLGLYLKNPGELELKELPSLIFLKEDDVKIKLIYGGICGSDIGVYKGKLGHAKYPLVPGHELVGEIIEVGEKVPFTVGTRVVVTPNTFCDECENCLNGRKNICINKKSLGVNISGIFAEEIIISSKFVLPIPEILPSEKAVLIEPFAVIVHAFQKFNISKDTSICVIGCGTEGMFSIALANYIGAQVTAVDINEKKIEKVRNAFPGVKIARPQEVQKAAFNVVIEAAGARASAEQALNIIKPGGTIVYIGLAPEATFPVTQIVRNEITIKGSIIYSFPEDFEKCVEYLMDEDFDVKPIVSNIIPLRNFERAYADAISGQYGKILIDFKEKQNS